MQVHILHTGKVGVFKGTPIRDPDPLKKFGFFQSDKDKIELPVSAYLIEHPKGTILIDTGWSQEIAQTGAPWPLSHFSTPILKKEEALIYQLDRMGLKPENIDAVYLSHLDFDHTSGLVDLTKAKAFHASKPEIEDTKFHLLRYQRNTFDMVDLQPFEFQETGIGPKGKSYDVFGDGSVLFVNTPGHTDGLLSVLVKDGNGKYIILASDTVYLQRSIDEGILPGYCMSTYDAAKSVEWLKEKKQDPNCLLITGNHDPSIQPQTIILDETGQKDPVFLLNQSNNRP